MSYPLTKQSSDFRNEVAAAMRSSLVAASRISIKRGSDITWRELVDAFVQGRLDVIDSKPGAMLASSRRCEISREEMGKLVVMLQLAPSERIKLFLAVGDELKQAARDKAKKSKARKSKAG